MAACGVQPEVKLSDNLQAVTFDAGGTLIYPWASVGNVYAEVAASHGFKNVSSDLLNHNFAAAWQAKKNFNHTRSDWSELVNATFVNVLPTRPDSKFFDDLYDRFAQPDCWKIFDDVLPIIDELRSRDIRLAVISNWDERLQLLMPRLNLSRFFETLVVSCEVGFPKPSPVIFNYALRKLGLPPEAVLHVGDSFVEDVEGARAVGMHSVLISRKTSENGALSKLTDLIKLL